MRNNTLIVYATRHGCTKEAALSLKEKLKEDVLLIDILNDTPPELRGFETVIVGGSIHAGKIQREIRQFLRENQDQLVETRLGLFLCCMYEGEKAKSQFDEAYPQQLRNHATATGLFGGEFDFDKMTLFERAIVKKVAGVKESIKKLDTSAIDEFARAISTRI